MTRINITDDAPDDVRAAAGRFEAAADQLEEAGGSEAIVRGIYTEARLDAITDLLANMLSPNDLADWTAGVFESAALSMGEITEALLAREADEAQHDVLDKAEAGQPLSPAEQGILDALEGKPLPGDDVTDRPRRDGVDS